MSMGMNTNVKYKGRVYHIQTEDGGEDNPSIATLLFKDGGAVASAKKRDYVDLLQSDSCRETVAALMKEQHKTMIRKLVRGEIEGLDTLEQEDPLQTVFVKDVPEAEQVDRLVLSGDEKDLDALILEYLAKRDGNVA